MAHQSYSIKLTRHDRQEGDFNLLVPMITEAKLSQVWLYRKNSGRWYTPEEFEKQYANMFINNHEVADLLNNLVLRDPRCGNAALQKAIRQKTEQHQKEMIELTKKGEKFLNKVIEYFKDKNTYL